jgi:hypothetical protein
MQAGFSLVGQKPNAKRVNLVGSVLSLGLVVGSMTSALGHQRVLKWKMGFQWVLILGFGRIGSPEVSAATVNIGVFRFEGFDPISSEVPDVVIDHVQSSLRPCSPVALATLNSSAEIAQKVTKPMRL